MFSKGASDIVLKTCSKIYTEAGEKPLNQEIQQQIAQTIDEYANKALRTILIVYKDLETNEGGEKHDEKDADGFYTIEKGNFVFFALVGIKDTIREEVPHAVEVCHKAGITVRMVTGDNKTTAIAIAREVGIFDKGVSITGNDAVEGTEFENNVLLLECKKCKNRINKFEY